MDAYRPDLPPFEVPASFRHEPELQAPAPRPVPDSLRRHPSRLLQRRGELRGGAVLLGLGLLSWFGRDSPAAYVAGLYFTPLDYLKWIAPVLALLGIGLLLGLKRKRDVYAYLRNGIPLAARVVDLRLEVAARVNGNDSQLAYDVDFEFPDPRTGELVYARKRSRKLPAAGADRYHLRCRVGDYVSAVYLPGDIEKTVQLYGFTGINPDADLIVQNRRWNGYLAAVALFLVALGALLYACSWYPLADDQHARALALSLLPGVVVGIALGWRRRSRVLAADRLRAEQAYREGLPYQGQLRRRHSAVAFPLVGAALGAMASGAVLLTLNGALDYGATRTQPLEVEGAYKTTHNLLVCTYELHYKDPGNGQSEHISVSPLDLEAEHQGWELVTHPGALGWPWVRARPVVGE